jgi:hypothetical protein
MGGSCGRFGGEKDAYMVLVGKREGKSRCEWKENIEIDIQGIGLESGLD